MLHSSHVDIAWCDEGASLGDENENLSSNVDSNFGFDTSYGGLPLSSDPLLEDCSYEQLLSELARRSLEVKEEVTFDLVRKTYRVEKQLGKGSSGVVHLVYHKGVAKRFALKIIEKSGPLNDQLSMATEIDIMKRVNHPRVIRLYELYEAPDCKWLILELVEAGGLRSRLSTMKRQNKENLTAKFVKQILEGLQYLHELGIVHRDMKIDNILFQGDIHTGSVKIADFGLSAFLKAEQGYPTDALGRKKYKSLKAAWGTPTHYSPELIAGAYGPQTDMWSLGCVVYEMLTGCNAFPPAPRVEQSKYKDLFKRIRTCSYNRTKLYHYSKECRNFIDQLLVPDPVLRMSPSEALKHPWIVDNDIKSNAMRNRRTFPKIILSFNLLNCMGSRKRDARRKSSDSQQKERTRFESVHSEDTSEGKMNMETESDGKHGSRNNENNESSSINKDNIHYKAGEYTDLKPIKISRKFHNSDSNSDKGKKNKNGFFSRRDTGPSFSDFFTNFLRKENV